MRFSRQGYWSGLPCPLPGVLPNPGIKPRSPALQADSLLSEPTGKPVKHLGQYKFSMIRAQKMLLIGSQGMFNSCVNSDFNVKKYETDILILIN